MDRFEFNFRLDVVLLILLFLIFCTSGGIVFKYIIGVGLTAFSVIVMYILAFFTNNFKSPSFDRASTFMWGTFLSIVMYCWYLLLTK